MPMRRGRSPRVGRLAIQFGAAFSLAMLAAGAIVFVVAEAQMTRMVDAELIRHRDELIGSGLRAQDDLREIARRIARWEAARAMTDRGYVLFDGQGRRIGGHVELAPPPLGFSDVRFRDGRPQLREGRALVSPLGENAKLVVIEHSEVAEDMQAILVPFSLVLFLAASLAGLGASLLFARMIAAKLVKTQVTADAIANGDLSHRLAADPRDGIFAEQAASFNRMLDRMEEMLKSQRQLARNLAHDLRTPLTRLRGVLAEGAIGSAEAQALAIVRASRECASIMSIFDALLRLSEIEAGRHPAAMRSLALRPLVEDVVESMEPVFSDSGRSLATGSLDDALIHADAGLINQLLVNLLENITHHTPAGTHSIVSVTHSGDRSEAIVAIADDGPGIALTERARMFEPFQRGNSAGSDQGNGLGLAIASAIARFHRGKIKLADNGPGLTVLLHFPIADSDLTFSRSSCGC